MPFYFKIEIVSVSHLQWKAHSVPDSYREREDLKRIARPDRGTPKNCF